MINIHASCVSLRGKGVLIIGDSGFGKSDLCLRLIMDKKARLVADDRVDLSVKKQKITASAPKNLFGFLEVRGIGIVPFPAQKSANIALVIALKTKREDIERLPEQDYYEYENIKIPQISLYAFDCSATDKVLLALSINKYKS